MMLRDRFRIAEQTHGGWSRCGRWRLLCVFSVLALLFLGNSPKTPVVGGGLLMPRRFLFWFRGWFRFRLRSRRFNRRPLKIDSRNWETSLLQ